MMVAQFCIWIIEALFKIVVYSNNYSEFKVSEKQFQWTVEELELIIVLVCGGQCKT